jgi:hypothetical protein
VFSSENEIMEADDSGLLGDVELLKTANNKIEELGYDLSKFYIIVWHYTDEQRADFDNFMSCDDYYSSLRKILYEKQYVMINYLPRRLVDNDIPGWDIKVYLDQVSGELLYYVKGE